MKSEKYLSFVRTLPCALCGSHPSEAHHAINIGLGGYIGGKVSDILSMPLCQRHHAEIHRIGRDDSQKNWVLKTITKAIDHGIITVS